MWGCYVLEGFHLIPHVVPTYIRTTARSPREPRTYLMSEVHRTDATATLEAAMPVGQSHFYDHVR